MVTYFVAESDGVRRLEINNDPKLMTCNVNIMVRENKLWLCIDGRSIVRIYWSARPARQGLPSLPARQQGVNTRACSDKRNGPNIEL